MPLDVTASIRRNASNRRNSGGDIDEDSESVTMLWQTPKYISSCKSKNIESNRFFLSRYKSAEATRETVGLHESQQKVDGLRSVEDTKEKQFNGMEIETSLRK